MDIFTKQIEQDPKMNGKPQNVIDGILKGKLSKHLDEVCFVNQTFVKDDKLSVEKKMEAISKEIGSTLSFGEIVLYVLGK